MSTKISQWIKNNKLSAFLLLLIVLYLFFLKPRNILPVSQRQMSGAIYNPLGYDSSYSKVGVNAPTGAMYENSYSDTAEVSTEEVVSTEDRKMITTTSLSLQVKNVNEVIAGLKAKIAGFKGYIVDINITRPELGESATVRFRVPVDKVDETLEFLRNSSIKVASEMISGKDITNKYTDYEERLKRSEETKMMLENILKQATKVEEILNVQNQIFRVQDEIDRYKGQIRYLNEASQTSMITAYLSTDEAALPYTEPLSWRPEVVFKYAVRSLIGTIQSLGTALIWLGVYSVLIVPAVTIIFIVILIKKKKDAKNNEASGL